MYHLCSIILFIERKRQRDVECASPVDTSSVALSSIDDLEDIVDEELEDEPKQKRPKGIYGRCI